MKSVYNDEDKSQDQRMQTLKEIIYSHSLIYYSHEAEHNYKLAYTTNPEQALEQFITEHQRVTDMVEKYSNTNPHILSYYRVLFGLQEIIHSRDDNVKASTQRKTIEEFLHLIRKIRYVPIST
jgi:Asp-tRNA(Asn)/Glu-tRNA(Gln) amidotransferase C subunit